MKKTLFLLLLSAVSCFGQARTALNNPLIQSNIDMRSTYKLTNLPATVLADWGIMDAVGGSTLTNYVLKTTTVNGHSLAGNIAVTTSDVGLGSVNNTSDAAKPVSTATQTALDLKVNANGAIVSATKTKITYGANGLVMAGVDATTADIADSTDRRYTTDAQRTVVQNTSGINTGDQDLSGLVPKTTTVNGHLLSVNVTVTATDVGLGNVDNTSDVNKPVSTAQQTALSLKAPLASPTFTSVPLAPTAAVDTNTTQLATTAYVINQGYAKLASPTFTGIPAAPTAAADTSTTQVATTAFVLAQAAASTPIVAGTGAVGTSTRYARADHVHPAQTTVSGNAGTATTWAVARSLAGNSVNGSVDVPFTNKFVVQGTIDSGLSNAQFLGALGTGIVKNTTTTGVLSIAVVGDFPVLNQNTTGSAGTITTPRAINGVNFDGSAPITVAAAAGTVTGTTLASNVVSSSLTSAAGGSFGTAAFTATGAYATAAQGTKADNVVTVNGIIKSNGTTPSAAIAKTDYWDTSAMVASGGSHAKGLVPDPGSSAATTHYLREDGTWVIPPNSGGTVTSYSSSDLSPIFTTSVATSTTTPAVTFTLSNAAANTVFGNFTGSSASPIYSATPTFSGANITALTASNITASTTVGRNILNLTNPSAISFVKIAVDNSVSTRTPAQVLTDILGAPLASPTFTGTVTFPSPFTVGSTSVTTTGVELNYVAGVTSAIQTQLNGKQATGSYAVLSANTFTGTQSFSGDITIFGTTTAPGSNTGIALIAIGPNQTIQGEEALGSGATLRISQNASQNVGGWKYISTDLASNYYQFGGSHVFRTAVSGTAGNSITWATQVAIDALRTTFSGPAKLKGYTVSTLPTGSQGDTAFVTDALTPSFGVTLVGGGAIVTKAFYNGTNWVAE